MVALTHSPVPPDPLRDGPPTTPELARHVVTLAATAAGTPHGGLAMATPHDVDDLVVTSTTLASVALGIAGGPGPDDLAENIVVVRDTSLDARWPTWSTTLVGLGVCSVLVAPVQTMHRPPGVLAVHADRTDAFSDAEVAAFGEVATVASSALAVALDRDGLPRALTVRRLIGIGIGMLVERYDLSVERAFGVLVRHSQHLNLKLRDVARHLVENGELPEQAPDERDGPEPT
ncbi:GAF and ANTAR domain-containing protein [Aeromicrobium sp. REDSEA-S38_B2]|uniref:GAF and ANTAR domain-containing protein n=1 Tax=Aeromicrobium sp. REDSEA-S38_B2 TaxID=1811528 RepID=UPI000A911C78